MKKEFTCSQDCKRTILPTFLAADEKCEEHCVGDPDRQYARTGELDDIGQAYDFCLRKGEGKQKVKEEGKGGRFGGCGNCQGSDPCEPIFSDGTLA